MALVLIIEDEKPISELIKLNLNLAGIETLQAFNGNEGLKCIQVKPVDLVLLDIKLPGLSGLELLPRILKRNIPVIFLTSKDTIRDKVNGLESGADDYITKPFEATELVARVKAVLRRYKKDKNSDGFDDIEMLFDCRKVKKGNQEIELTLKEYELLKCLLENKNIALSREKLLELVWGYEYPGNTRTVDIHVQKIRNKLGTDRIKTVYKMGYRLEI